MISVVTPFRQPGARKVIRVSRMFIRFRASDSRWSRGHALGVTLHSFRATFSSRAQHRVEDEQRVDAVSAALAAVAIVVSVYSVFRQIRVTRSSKDLDFTIQMILENIRKKDFQRDQRYVFERLAAACPPSELGADGEPHGIDNIADEEAREAAWHVCIMYETVGIAYALQLTDERIIRSVFSYRIRQAWDALEPYIENERKRRGDPFLPFFENLREDVIENTSGEVYKDLHLKLRGGSTW